MKKNVYRALKNRHYRALMQLASMRWENIFLKNERDRYKEKTEYYEKRFREFGKNVETIEPDDLCIKQLKWEIRPEQFGDYAMIMKHFDQSVEEMGKALREKVVRGMAEAMIENNLVQFIENFSDEDDPFSLMGTIGAKMYVIPWEQMPHKRTIEIRQYVENTLEEGETL